MRTIAIALVVFLISAAAFAADQSSAGASSKLTAMLEAKDANGKPVVSSEDQAYFNGLNDNLRALLNDLVQKEVITRPEHLATLLGLQLRPQKMEVLLQNRCILCHTDPESQSAENLFSVGTGSRQPAGHMNLKEIVEDVHFRRGPLLCRLSRWRSRGRFRSRFRQGMAGERSPKKSRVGRSILRPLPFRSGQDA